MPAPYLTWMLIFVILPTGIMWLFAYKMLLLYLRTFIYCILLSNIFGILWDIYAIKTKIWQWPDVCCVLPRIGSFPLEEAVFITFVTIYVVTLTLVLRQTYLNHHENRRVR